MNNELPVPVMNVQLAENKQEKQELVNSEKMLGLLNEVMDDIREEKKSIEEITSIFQEMVINGGDSSNSSKEALVNLIRLRAECADRKTKIVDLAMRAFLKQNDTFPKYLTAVQNNEFKSAPNRRQLIKAMEEEKQTDDKR